MIEYRGYIIEHEFGFGGDKYYVYEPKEWGLVKIFQNQSLRNVKKYIDDEIEGQNNE